jgi:hypothetical protein
VAPASRRHDGDASGLPLTGAGPDDEERLPARTLGYLFLAGATIGLVSLLLPLPARAHDDRLHAGRGRDLHRQALRIVERFRTAIPDAQGCSAGLAAWNGAETAEELLDRADRALYEAKRTGRNRSTTAAVSG